jgi:CRP-like cAMP-binding protein
MPFVAGVSQIAELQNVCQPLAVVFPRTSYAVYRYILFSLGRFADGFEIIRRENPDDSNPSAMMRVEIAYRFASLAPCGYIRVSLAEQRSATSRAFRDVRALGVDYERIDRRFALRAAEMKSAKSQTVGAEETMIRRSTKSRFARCDKR